MPTDNKGWSTFTIGEEQDFTVEGWASTAQIGASDGVWVSPSTVVEERLDTIEKRLCIIDGPDSDLLKKYPALQEAYDHYKLVEKLVNESG